MSIPSLYEEHAAPGSTRAVRALIAINVAILFLQWTVVSDADAFAFLGFREGGLPRGLWSAGTYMFLHFGVLHLALNMYALHAFGPRLERAMGTRTFTFYYLWCGLGGAVAHVLFVRTGILIGASAAVLGVMFGYAQQWPDEEVALFGVIPMRAWTMVMLFIVANLGIGLLDVDPSLLGDRKVYLAHLGGLAFGWLYLRTPPAASLERFRQRVSPAPDYHDELPRPVPRTMPRTRALRDEIDEVVAQSKAIASQQKRPAQRPVIVPARTVDEQRVAELDRVLDKISRDGLESLTPAERTALDAIARRMRGES